MAEPEKLKPVEMAATGLIGTLSMREFSPEPKAVDEALNGPEQPVQGGTNDPRSDVSFEQPKFGRDRSPVSPGF